jgi:mRNA-decapping enzyme subunit 2
MKVDALRPMGTTARHASYGAIIYSQNNKILLVLGRNSNKWSFPKGHADDGEGPFECVIRETYEETGFTELPNPSKSHRMRFGVFYEFHVDDEFVPAPVDRNEIEDARWFTVAEAKQLTMNSDTGVFINGLTS